MPLQPLRIAFIGAGFVNFGGGEGPWDHASRLEQMPNVEVAAICDPDQARATAQLERRKHGARPDIYRNCRILSGWRELLTGTRPDAAIIGLPPAAHGRMTGDGAVELAFAQAGIHMLIEKPLAVSDPAQVKELAAVLSTARAASGNPLVTSVGYMLRYHNVVNELRALLGTSAAQGQTPCVFLGRYAAAYPFILSPSFWDARQSGGPIIEQATHFVDLARYLLGEIELDSIVAQQIGAQDPLGQLAAMPSSAAGRPLDENTPADQRIPRATIAQWRFTSGAMGSLAHGLLQHGKAYDTELEVWADGLRAVLSDPYSDQCQLQVRSGDFRSSPRPITGVNDPYLAEMEAFLCAIRENRLDLIRSPYQDAAKTFEVTCRIAAESGRKFGGDAT